MTTQFERELLAKQGELEADLSIVEATLKTYVSYKLEAEAQVLKSELLAIGAELESLSKTCPRCRKSYNGNSRKSKRVIGADICRKCKTEETVMELGYETQLDPEYVREFESARSG
jgi:hypothetical protein